MWWCCLLDALPHTPHSVTMPKRAVTPALKQLVFERLLPQVFLDTPARDEDVLKLVRRLRPEASARPLRRIGGPADGGYLIPDDLEGVVGCISPGVSSEVGFDLALAEMGIPVFLADASVQGPPVQHPLFHFYRKHIHPARAEDRMSLNELYSLALGRSSEDGDFLLEMDIEGGEYSAILDLSTEHLARTRIIVIEFHGLRHLFSSFGRQMLEPVFDKVLESHAVVHAHPNNAVRMLRRGRLAIPQVMEFTFLRRDREFLPSREGLHYPHPLDRDNVPGRPHISLPEYWYRDSPHTR